MAKDYPTVSQLKCYEATKKLASRKGYAPTIKEVAVELGCSIGVVKDWWDALDRKGYIKRQSLPNSDRYMARSVECLR